ncbi:hypothetical protein SLEP1_g16104 [Rubroshorea leprosula]|uniref:Uncharacterized protein n=1 Tax=Rubroshorea leprosula TaxID=152421 RepID=A0AAV5IPR5_9ROSI|nr:hypothetical protein SLEP1_g16104 [Rubroshorea leprosula]
MSSTSHEDELKPWIDINNSMFNIDTYSLGRVIPITIK